MHKHRPSIICEIGLNHLGKKEYLYQYYKHLKLKNIDALTIQIVPDGSFKGKLKKCKLNYNLISEFIDLIKKSNKKIGIAISDYKKIDFFKKKKVDFYKVLSGDLNNLNLINGLLKTKKKIFISTGLGNFRQIKSTLKKIKSKKIELIHTSFSRKINKINFRRIHQLRNRFKLPVCYGNHSPYLDAISTSVHYNPVSIFFYVKLNDRLNFPDNDHAVNIKDIDKILNSINLNLDMIK